jgi:acyl-CoA oxidase
MISGLPEIVASTTCCCTFEGEKTVMWKQVAKYLMKGMAAPSLPHDMAYMRKFWEYSVCDYQGKHFLQPEVLIEIFEHRAARLIYDAYQLLCNENGSRLKAENTHAVALQSAARAHIDLSILKVFIAQLSSLPASPHHTALHHLLLLFALTTISSPLSLSSSFTFLLSSSQLSTLRSQTNDLLEQLLPDAIALTDAWGFSDACLSSALGCRDGDVYVRVMEWTRQLRVNVRARANGGVLREGWEGFVRPFLREGERRAGERAKL